MTDHEFRTRFLVAHFARFPDVHRFLSESAAEIGLEPGAITRAWFDDHFRYLSLDACLEASRLMAQDEQLEPKRAEKHPPLQSPAGRSGHAVQPHGSSSTTPMSASTASTSRSGGRPSAPIRTAMRARIADRAMSRAW